MTSPAELSPDSYIISHYQLSNMSSKSDLNTMGKIVYGEEEEDEMDEQDYDGMD